MKLDYEPTNIRLTKKVKHFLSNKARENCRSLSGEIQHRLEKLMEQEQSSQKESQQ